MRERIAPHPNVPEETARKAGTLISYGGTAHPGEYIVHLPGLVGERGDAQIPQEVADDLEKRFGDEWWVSNRGTRIELVGVGPNQDEYGLRNDSHVAETVIGYMDELNEYGDALKNPELDPELRGQIEANFTDYMSRVIQAEGRGLPEREIDENEAKALARELGFARKLIGSATEMSRRQDGPVTILFDVDETIARNSFGEDDQVTTYVRPALEPTVRHLQSKLGDRLEVGLLTSRSESHLYTELESPTYLSGISDVVNPNFVVSSRSGSSIYQENQSRDGLINGLRRLEYADDEEDIVSYTKDILDPSIVETLANDGYPHPMWWNIKLGILQKLVNQHRDRGFVFVEDMACADSVRKDHNRVMAVRVYEDAGFFNPID